MARSAATVVVTEVERKFDLAPGVELPGFDGLPGVASVGGAQVHDLDATYVDSVDLRLIANRITLRRRTGGDDAGWHLKLPRGDGERDELRRPLGRSARALPAPLRSQVEVHLRGAEVLPVVRLVTRRVVRHLLDGAGSVLAEVADDEVTATVTGGSTAGGTADQTLTWREVEVELVAGDEALLDAVAARLGQAGARPSDSRSKLAKALGDRVPAPRRERPRDVRRSSAGGVVLEHLREQVAALVAHDPQARADVEDAVHQMRVASRRLRSALAAFRPLFDDRLTEPLRDELAWLGGELGAVRDAEVVRDHVVAAVRAQPRDLVVGPVLRRVTSLLRQRHRAAHDELLVQLSTPRYFALLDALDALVDDPPLTPPAAQKADAVLPRLLYRTWRRAHRQVLAADAAEGAERDLLLHEVRKAAKRARYAGESIAARYGRPARRYAARMKAVQDVLGSHHDSVLIRRILTELAGEAQRAGEPTFTYGRLHALEESRAGTIEEDFALAWGGAERMVARTPPWR